MASMSRRDETYVERLALVLDMRSSGDTFRQIGDSLGVTQARAWQLFKSAQDNPTAYALFVMRAAFAS